MALTSIRSRIITLVWVAGSFVSIIAFAAPPEKLGFFRYSIGSEALADWTIHSQTDRAGTSELLGLFSLKKDPKAKLMAFRRNDEGEKICAKERSLMNINKVKYEKLTAPKGWACLYEEKESSRVTAVKSFYIKGKTRSTAFALVLVGESLPKDRFLKAVDALKDVP
ncbi:MAG: hypothetical protein V4760_12485 [Bdellovibrionota bacterium]